MAITAIGVRFQGLRIVDPSAERTILNTMRQYGQLTPLVVCRLESGSDELRDPRTVLGKDTEGVRLAPAEEKGLCAEAKTLNEMLPEKLDAVLSFLEDLRRSTAML